MFITKKHIPRRRFLQGAGVTLALPLLQIDGAGGKMCAADAGGAVAHDDDHLEVGVRPA